MKNFRKISVIIILIFLTTILSAQDNYCNIKKSFPVKKGILLRLSNKYGDVNIITVQDDSLSVCATISIEQDNNDMLQKSIKLIKISAEKTEDTINISTLYDKKFFSEESRSGRKSFRVDYLIKMPAYLDLNIKDEFGNVSVDELSGTFTLRLSQGTLNAKKLSKGNLKPVSSVFADHSKIIIEELNWMTFTVVNCPLVSIGKAQAMVMTSSVSKIKTGEISSLVSYSKSDSYNIKSINNLISESNYSSCDIGKLNGQLKSKVTFGSVSVSDLDKWFGTVDIVSDQSLISLKTGKDVSFSSDIIVSNTDVEFPSEKFPGIIRSGNNQTATLQGITGADNGTKSLIKIRAKAGKVIIQ